MSNVWKRFIGTMLLAMMLISGGMMSWADEVAESVPSPHILYQMFTNGSWSKEFQDGESIGEASHTAVEGIKIRLSGVEGSVSYRVYLSDGGWQNWVSDGAVAGHEGEGSDVEAIQIKLNGYVSQVLDVWYNTTVSGYGKLGWARTGSPSGSAGEGKVVTDMSAYLTQVNQNVGDGGAIHTSLPYGFYEADGQLHYTDAPGANYTGWLDKDGVRYYIKDTVAVKDWQYIDGFKFYFDGQSHLVQDLTGMINASSYVLKINKQLNCLTVYANDGNNGYIIPIKAMLCSVGDDTPLGTFHTPEKYRWRLMVNDTYTQYATRITAGKGFLIHSICYDQPNIYTMQSVGYNGLGVVRSLGCVRLNAGNAKWVYDNCAIGTTIQIYEDSTTPGPFYKPTVTPVPLEQNWDPTDPLVSQEKRAEGEARQAELAAQKAAEEQAAAAQRAAEEQAAAAKKAAEEQAAAAQQQAEEATKEIGPGIK